MMINEKAIEKLKSLQMIPIIQYDDFVALEIAIEALETHIPKKVTHEATLRKCATCPTCQNVIDEFMEFNGNKARVETNNCKFCGQALDWSDKNDD